MNRFGLTPRKIIILVLIVLGFFLLMDLNNRLTNYFNLSRQRDQLQTEVSSMKRTEIYLVTEIAYAQSIQAVEDWAREQGHMVQTGDVPIIPLGQGVATPTPLAQPTPVIPPPANWEVWYALFFGQ